MNEIFTVEQLSDYLKIPKSCLYQKVMRREIPFYRIGRLLRFKRSDIDQWLDAHRVETFDAKGKAKIILDAVLKNALSFRPKREPACSTVGKGKEMMRDV